MLERHFSGSINTVLEPKSIVHSYFVQAEVKSLFHWHVFLDATDSG